MFSVRLEESFNYWGTVGLPDNKAEENKTCL